MWKKKSTKLLLDHPRLKVYEDQIELPGGYITDYLHYSSSDGVSIIAKKDNKILLSKEYSYPVNKVLWQFPGGGLNPSESAEQGAIRELREEAKFKPHNVRLLGSYLHNNRRTDSKMYVCLAEELEFSPLPGDKEESIENFWFEEREIDNLIGNGEIENANVLAAWCLYKLSKIS